MGNRILKESIRMNPRISQLSFFEETVFYRLLVTVDDYGVFPAHPLMLSRVLFPMREDVTKDQVKEALSHLEALGLIFRYEVEGDGEYLKITSWERNQRLRNSVHRYPMPEEGTLREREESDTGAKGKGAASAAKAPHAPAARPSDDASAVPLSEAQPKQLLPDQAEVKELPVIELPLNDQQLYPVTREDIASYQELYPAVDVVQALRNMKGWCISNPTRRKTRSGIQKFINGWLAREQNRGGLSPGVSPDNPYNVFIQGGTA